MSSSPPIADGRPHHPRPSDWRVAVWRTFLRAHATVMRDLERELAADVGMPLGWYDVLLQLVERSSLHSSCMIT